MEAEFGQHAFDAEVLGDVGGVAGDEATGAELELVGLGEVVGPVGELDGHEDGRVAPVADLRLGEDGRGVAVGREDAVVVGDRRGPVRVWGVEDLGGNG